IFGPDGTQLLDNWDIAPATYDLRDPAKEPWVKDMARLLDNAFDAIVGAKQPPPLTMPEPEHLQGWKEALAARASGGPVTALRRAPEGTAFVSAAVAIPGHDSVLLVTTNARDIRRVVRSERLALGFILLGTIALSVLL